jgi:hypothetical protein
MMNNRYPKISIRSKNELAKHISSKKLPYDKALALINDVQENYDKYWRDHPKQSQPNKGKWVRDASSSNLGRLLKHIDSTVLKPNDKLIPNFIFGGISGRNHKNAVQNLQGKKRKRAMLKLDITKFFEQNRYDRVYHFFLNKAGCSKSGAKLLADLCCVYYGAKNKPENYKTIARGFPTSPRLAVWCNLDVFIKLDRLIRKELKDKDPRISIYVDDIGITASRVTKEELMKLYPKVKAVLESDKNQLLPLNESKTKIVLHSGDTFDIEGNFKGRFGFELLGLHIGRNKLTLGTKTRWKLVDLTNKLRESKGKNKDIKKKRKSTLMYKNYIHKQ